MANDAVRHWVAEHQVRVRFCPVPEEAPRVADAARVLGVGVDQVIKSLLFLVGGAPVLVIACGLSRIDDRTLADHFGVARKQVALAPFAEALTVAGFAPGIMPPFGHKTPLPTLLDAAVLEQPLVYGGTGDPLVLLELAPAELQRVTGAISGSFVKQ